MIIIGAKSFAKEILEILYQKNDIENLSFYDDITENFPDLLYQQFKIIKNISDAQKYFKTVDKKFTIGVGNPKLRYKLYEKFTNAGGELQSVISKFSEIGSFGVDIGNGCIIMGGVKISNDVKIGKGVMIYYNSVITHDVEIADFVEISPSVNILGRAKIGKYSQIGAGATIFPDVEIGSNVVVAAGSVVRNNIPDNVMAAGVPAKIKKINN
jgi:sugar O-acyltransferase (sialic acid O-acetyltransferase NeuD family)